ncbi:MAG: dihydrolipoamide acetyltransferase family protein [Cyclobacteriaceae bacterium]|nr:dihydrolipoamide acetyltransferase family protein [Cyclobacteriaceae bacterium]
MAEAVIMPRQGQSVESCIFSEWYKKPGDKVSKGELLFSYETDKAAFEQDAPADGILLAALAKGGDEIPVLSVIGVIGQAGESIEDFLSGGMENMPKTQQAEVPEVAPSAEDVTVKINQSPATGDGQKISPRARLLAEKHHLDYSVLAGSGPEGRIIERDILSALASQPKATPLAKSIAAHDHVALPAKGSGAGGKVLAADVRFKPSEPLANDYTDKKISNIRKIIAANMYESLANTAQLTLHTSADARKILGARRVLKEKMVKGYTYNITITDMVAMATIRALLKNPDINVHFMPESIRYFSNVHLGFAVDTPRGLMVPTVKNANHLTIEGLSATMKSLAEACQKGSVDPESLKGATFTITNLGGFGIEMFTPVLNPPQAGILGVNTISPQPADLGDGVFGFIPKIGLSLTFDHRALDGAPAARFLQGVVLEIEQFEI